MESSRLSKSLDSGSCLDESCESSEHFSDLSSNSRMLVLSTTPGGGSGGHQAGLSSGRDMFHSLFDCRDESPLHLRARRRGGFDFSLWIRKLQNALE